MVMEELTMSKQQTEIQYLKNEINQLRNDMRNLILVLIDLKILKVTTDENGKAVYDTGSDGKP
jgi:PleD family two-component response regulator